MWKKYIFKLSVLIFTCLRHVYGSVPLSGGGLSCTTMYETHITYYFFLTTCKNFRLCASTNLPSKKIHAQIWSMVALKGNYSFDQNKIIINFPN